MKPNKWACGHNILSVTQKITLGSWMWNKNTENTTNPTLPGVQNTFSGIHQSLSGVQNRLNQSTRLQHWKINHSRHYRNASDGRYHYE